MALPGWEVPTHRLRLPPGFSLREDDHLLYVCCGERTVLAVFSASLSQTALQAAIDCLAHGARATGVP
jgi:hypothetical protein